MMQAFGFALTADEGRTVSDHTRRLSVSRESIGHLALVALLFLRCFLTYGAPLSNEIAYIFLTNRFSRIKWPLFSEKNHPSRLKSTFSSYLNIDMTLKVIKTQTRSHDLKNK